MSTLYIPSFSEEETKRVIEKLDPLHNRACNNNLLWNSGSGQFSGDFSGHSLKRSHLTNCVFNGAVLDHTSFAGSFLENIKFMNTCTVESAYFEHSTLINVNFDSGLNVFNSSFHNCYLLNCSFKNCVIRSTYFSNSTLDHCNFENCTIRSTMFDGAYITNTNFINCNMRNLNIEFAHVDYCDFTNTVISYFQIPYIIGLFKGTNNITYLGAGKDKNIVYKMSDYEENILDAIIYYSSLQEYFPLASLYFKKGDKSLAKNCLIAGIDTSIKILDMNMVENYCALGQAYDLLNINQIKQILEKIDIEIEKKRNDPDYGMLLTKSYHLRALVYRDKSQSTLEIIINTNIDKINFDVVGDFCGDIDNLLALFLPNKITTTYQVSHNSPFEICVNCVGLTADLIAISGVIYRYILSRYRGEKTPAPEIKTYIENSNKIFLDSLNSQFDDLKLILSHTKKSEHDAIVEKFRGKIIENVSSHINKDFALIVSQHEDK